MCVLNSQRFSDYSKQALRYSVNNILVYLAYKKKSLIRSPTNLQPVKFHFSETLHSWKYFGTLNDAGLIGMTQQKLQSKADAQCGQSISYS